MSGRYLPVAESFSVASPMACCTARPVETSVWLPEDVTRNLAAIKALEVTDGYHTMPMETLLPDEQLVVTLCLRRYG
eukprot:COSAG02_NODE_11797_length_1654_cov_2.001932_1_plen_77_part_00